MYVVPAPTMRERRRRHVTPAMVYRESPVAARPSLTDVIAARLAPPVSQAAGHGRFLDVPEGVVGPGPAGYYGPNGEIITAPPPSVVGQFGALTSGVQPGLAIDHGPPAAGFGGVSMSPVADLIRQLLARQHTRPHLGYSEPF